MITNASFVSNALARRRALRGKKASAAASSPVGPGTPAHRAVLPVATPVAHPSATTQGNKKKKKK
jgi:hypothetical protein